MIRDQHPVSYMICTLITTGKSRGRIKLDLDDRSKLVCFFFSNYLYFFVVL